MGTVGFPGTIRQDVAPRLPVSFGSSLERVNRYSLDYQRIIRLHLSELRMRRQTERTESCVRYWESELNRISG